MPRSSTRHRNKESPRTPDARTKKSETTSRLQLERAGTTPMSQCTGCLRPHEESLVQPIDRYQLIRFSSNPSEVVPFVSNSRIAAILCRSQSWPISIPGQRALGLTRLLADQSLDCICAPIEYQPSGLEENQMTVHLISACWLTPNYYNAPDAVCNTYCRIRLLPGQNESTMKYSKLITRTNNPRWNQLFIFSNYSENEIAQHDLELTVWNCGLNTNEQTLLGEVIIDLSVADLTGETYWYPLQLGNHPDYSSEAPTPVVGSLTKYDMPPQFDSDRSSVSAPVDNRPVFDRPKIHQSELTEREDLKYAGSAAQKSGDYSDIDERRFGSGSVYAPVRGPNRVEQLRSSEDHRRPSAQTNARTRHSEYGPDDHASHSDFSEFSDVSETSRMSSRTGQSERERRRPSNQSSSYSTHHRSSRPEITGTRRIPDMSRLSEEEVDGAGDKSNFSGRSGGQEISANLQQQAAKESSSSETGSGLIKSAPESGTDQTAKSSTALGTSQSSSQPDSHSRRGEPRRGRPSIGHKFSTVLGRSHKSSSTSTLDKKTKSSFQRSEEVLPSSTSGFYADDSSESRMHHQISLSSGRTDNISNNDGTDQDSRASPSLMRNDLHVGEFVEGLGPGQLVGRQVLGMPCLGEIQLSFLDRRGRLEVEVIRARGLQHKNSSKPLPAPYVKLHLLEGKQSVEKLRTTAPPRRTLDPLYQQQLTFSVPYHGKIMQVSVWGEYGRMDKKVFLGMCEIVLDDLDLKSVVFGWYKLFGMIAASAHHQPPYGTTGPHTEDRTNPDEEKQQRPGSKSKGEKVSPRSRGKSVSGRPKPRNSVSGNGSVRTRTKSVGDRASGPRKSVSRDSKRSASSAHQTRETAQR
ncbi:unnamed protein product [Calicophoron daubneyi]|uniref:C2 domain-containing protein n=1 Tax=Calicophoron daubneyi TaxID=300641 RepID=A0AAV2U041_CALDB